MKPSWLGWAALLAASIIFASVWTRNIDPDQPRCNHGASSIAGVMRHGKFVITHPAYKTGC